MTTATSTEALAFPSVAWFERLATLMEEDRALHEHIGTIDCTAQFTVLDAAGCGVDRHFQVTFEEYDAVSIREVGAERSEGADFVIETDLSVWAEMLENIRAGGGRPDLEHSLNRLSLPGTPIRVWAADPLGRDMFFRFNSSLQAFVNAVARVPTVYPDLDG